jgi:RHS repeat-associated protein
MKVAQRSNRSVSWADGGREPDPDAFFDPNGNQQILQPGQAMEWSLRNQLRQVSQVVRKDAANDSELYQYDASGSRLRKSRMTTSGSQGQVSATHYLPALELHSNTMTGERLQVIDVVAGVLDLRVLHWDSVPPEGLANDRFRYAVHNLLGSVTLELDENGRVISHEEYHPYGSTAWWASGSAVEASYKSVRYSGKIRDTTGLYYYGKRFYAPWLMRWLSTDPALEADGLNLYQMVGSNPVSYRDFDGRNRDSVAQGSQIVPPDQRLAVAEEMIERISAYEPALTEVLDQAAAELGAELYGREYRVKGAESLAQKLSVAPPDQMNDVLRYTIGFPFGTEGPISEQDQQSFVQGVVRTFHALGSEGYQPVLIRNTFFPDQSYRGINANFLLPDGKTKFEVQVHTAQSYKVKSEGHGRYEAIRTLERELAGSAVDESKRLTIALELEDRKAGHREASAVIATPVGIQEWVPSKPEMQGFKWQPRQLDPQQRAFYEQRVNSNRKQLGQSRQGSKTVQRRHSF